MVSQFQVQPVSSVLCLVSRLIELIPFARRNWMRAEEFWHLFCYFTQQPLVSLFLLREGVIEKMVEFYLGNTKVVTVVEKFIDYFYIYNYIE